jgi:hypothetical protein
MAARCHWRFELEVDLSYADLPENSSFLVSLDGIPHARPYMALVAARFQGLWPDGETVRVLHRGEERRHGIL